MSKLANIDPRINQFCALVNQGIEAWVKAGQLLCEITRDDPKAYDKILRGNAHLTNYILECFERIGRKEIYPYLLADGSPGAKLLCGLPYERQIEVYRSTVLVAVKSKTGFNRVRKRVCDLTATEAKRVFDYSRIRTFEEQTKLFHNITWDSKYTPDPEQVGAAGLDEPPEHEVRRLLSTANDSVVEARSVMTMLKMTDDALDQLLIKSLNSIGELRYVVNELLNDEPAVAPSPPPPSGRAQT